MELYNYRETYPNQTSTELTFVFILAKVSYIGTLFNVLIIQDSSLFNVLIIQDSSLFNVLIIQDSSLFMVQYRQVS